MEFHSHNHSVSSFADVRQVRVPRANIEYLPSNYFRVWLATADSVVGRHGLEQHGVLPPLTYRRQRDDAVKRQLLRSKINVTYAGRIAAARRRLSARELLLEKAADYRNARQAKAWKLRRTSKLFTRQKPILRVSADCVRVWRETARVCVCVCVRMACVCMCVRVYARMMWYPRLIGHQKITLPRALDVIPNNWFPTYLRHTRWHPGINYYYSPSFGIGATPQLRSLGGLSLPSFVCGQPYFFFFARAVYWPWILLQ